MNARVLRGSVRPCSGSDAAKRQIHSDDLSKVPALLKALARAFRYQKLLDDGRYASISEMAAAEKIERGYLGSLLRLTLLAPEMVEAILDGRQPEGVTLPRLLEGVPVRWAYQREHLLSGALTRLNDRHVRIET